MRALYLDKTLQRLEQYARAAGLDLRAPCRIGGAPLPSLETIARRAAGAVPEPEPGHLALVHGDFCFSNILYDLRAEHVRVIDPRGVDAWGRPCTAGDLRYDVAKLRQSAVGKYDFIVAGYYRLNRRAPLDLDLDLPDDPPVRALRNAFLAARFAGFAPDALASEAICVLLFLSMLPLHAEDPHRQAALLANAMRLFREMDREGAR